MSNHDSLEALIKDEPSEFTTHVSEIDRRLASEDPHDRMDAGRTFRVVAEEHPIVLESQIGTLIELLSADNGSLQLSGALGIAGLAEPAPETASKAVPELAVLLDDTDAPAIQMAVLRALSRIEDMSPTAVSIVDRPVADLLYTATPQIRLGVVTIFANVLIQTPRTYPKTIGAIEDALGDESRRVRSCAAITLALIAETDPTALSSISGVLDQITELPVRRNYQPRHYTDRVERAIDILQRIDTDSPESK